MTAATALHAAAAPPATPVRTHSVFAVKPDHTGTLLNGEPFLAIGLRVSNGLIAHLDVFAGYGVNSLSVFFQGSRFGGIRGYREDATLDPVYAARMGRIIEAADARRMVVLVGVLYHGDSSGWWRSWRQEDAERAVANTVRWLKEHDYRNVFVDVNNEHMAKFDDARLIAAGKAVDPACVIGGGGMRDPRNADLSLHFGHPNLPDKYYIETEGSSKGYWGPYSRAQDGTDYLNIGLYTAEMKKQILEATDRTLDRGQGYFLASTWLQNPPPAGPHHTPGGCGTPGDPGVRWWLEHIRQRPRPDRPAAGH
jgi:hypothetical protein